jgi:hypothetical protein
MGMDVEKKGRVVMAGESKVLGGRFEPDIATASGRKSEERHRKLRSLFRRFHWSLIRRAGPFHLIACHYRLRLPPEQTEIVET